MEEKKPSCLAKTITMLKNQTFGKINVGIYYKKNQKYLSWTSVILSFLGLMLFLGLSINVIIRIFNYEQVTTENKLIPSRDNNIYDLKVTLDEFT